MSNRADETLPNQPRHRAKVAIAMARAIEGWFGQAVPVQRAG